MGDIASLANSIDPVGLLHPVVIDSANNLIAGERRIRAFQMLGREKVPVTIIDLAEVARGEYHENAIREPFQPTEVFAIYEVVGPLEVAAAKERQEEAAKRGNRARAGLEKLTTPEVPDDRKEPVRARDKIGKFAGVSGIQLQKIIAIMEAARSEPGKFGDLPAILDKSVNSAYRFLNKRRDEARVLQLPVPGSSGPWFDLRASIGSPKQEWPSSDANILPSACRNPCGNRGPLRGERGCRR